MDVADEFSAYTWRSGSALLESAADVEVRPGRTLRVLRRLPSSPERPTVLFVHGSAASMTQLLPLAAALAEQRGYGVVAYDWLGCGGSAKPDDWAAYGCDQLLEDLVHVYDQFCSENDSASTFVVGHSYGTHLVSRLALRLQTSGRAASGLILMGGALTLPEGHPIFRLPVFVLDRLQASLTTGFLRLALAPGADPELLADQEAACNRNPMYMCKAYYRQMRNADALGISQLSAPALVIHGEVDGVLPVDGAAALANALPAAGAPVIVPRASHNVMLEQPAEVARHVSRFITEHEAARASAL